MLSAISVDALAQPSAAAPNAAIAEKLNQNTVTVISGNPNGAYLYLAYDMPAMLDDGNELRVLPAKPTRYRMPALAKGIWRAVEAYDWQGSKARSAAAHGGTRSRTYRVFGLGKEE
jgi:hypothetical protein